MVRQDGHGEDAGLIVRTHKATDAALRQTVDTLRGLGLSPAPGHSLGMSTLSTPRRLC